MMINFYGHYLIYKYNFTCSLFWTTPKLTNDIKIILNLNLLGPFKALKCFLNVNFLKHCRAEWVKLHKIEEVKEVFLFSISMYMFWILNIHTIYRVRDLPQFKTELITDPRINSTNQKSKMHLLSFSFYSLCEMCPNTEFFLVRIFLHSDWIRENLDQKKLRIWTHLDGSKRI